MTIRILLFYLFFWVAIPWAPLITIDHHKSPLISHNYSCVFPFFLVKTLKFRRSTYIFMIFSCLVGDISIFHHEFPGFLFRPQRAPRWPWPRAARRSPGLRVPIGAVGPELCAGEPWWFWKTWRIWGGRWGFKANHGDLDRFEIGQVEISQGNGGDWVLKDVDLSILLGI